MQPYVICDSDHLLQVAHKFPDLIPTKYGMTPAMRISENSARISTCSWPVMFFTFLTRWTSL